MIGVEGNDYYRPALVFFTTEGEKSEHFIGTEKEKRKNIAKRISELGMEGWEMVGMGTTEGSMDYKNLHQVRSAEFRRAIHHNILQFCARVLVSGRGTAQDASAVLLDLRRFGAVGVCRVS